MNTACDVPYMKNCTAAFLHQNSNSHNMNDVQLLNYVHTDATATCDTLEKEKKKGDVVVVVVIVTPFLLICVSTSSLLFRLLLFLRTHETR